MRIGYVGLGAMGRPMAINLAKARHDLVVCDPDETATRILAQRGAQGGGTDILGQVLGEVELLGIGGSAAARRAVGGRGTEGRRGTTRGTRGAGQQERLRRDGRADWGRKPETGSAKGGEWDQGKGEGPAGCCCSAAPRQCCGTPPPSGRCCRGSDCEAKCSLRARRPSARRRPVG